MYDRTIDKSTRFPFLIGRIRTAMNVWNKINVLMKFPFLIGRIRTEMKFLKN